MYFNFRISVLNHTSHFCDKKFGKSDEKFWTSRSSKEGPPAQQIWK